MKSYIVETPRISFEDSLKKRKNKKKKNHECALRVLCRDETVDGLAWRHGPTCWVVSSEPFLQERKVGTFGVCGYGNLIIRIADCLGVYISQSCWKCYSM